MTNAELFERAIGSDFQAIETLKEHAAAGNAEAQYFLFCLFDDPTSPVHNTEAGMTWLQRSADSGFEEAQRAYNDLSPQERVRYHIEKEGDINEVYGSVKPGGMFSFRGRVGRQTFLVYYAIYLALALCLDYYVMRTPIGELTYNGPALPESAVWVGLAARLLVAYLALAVSVKRVHDCGHSGIRALIPLYNPFVLLVEEGQKGVNQYGAEPQ